MTGRGDACEVSKASDETALRNFAGAAVRLRGRRGLSLFRVNPKISFRADGPVRATRKRPEINSLEQSLFGRTTPPDRERLPAMAPVSAMAHLDGDRMDQPVSDPRPACDTSTFVRAAFILVGIVVLTLVAWQLISVALLFFGAIIIAIILRSLAALIERALPLSSQWSLAAACLLIAALGIGVSVLVGAQLVGQLTALVEQFPQQVDALGDRWGIADLGSRLAEQAKSFASRGNALQSVAGYTSGLLGVLTDLVLVLVGGIYLAARPGFYLNGCLRVFPASIRDNVASATRNAGRALQLWLLGQLVSMLLIGVLTTVGLYCIGMSSALVLGLIAGLTEFVPVVGPIIGAVPALVIALSQGGTEVFWVLGLYILVQQVESNLIVPLVQRRTVDLPPVLALFALLPLAVLFGPVGVVLGTPLTVVFYVAMRQLYLRDTLGQPTEVPGEESGA